MLRLDLQTMTEQMENQFVYPSDIASIENVPPHIRAPPIRASSPMDPRNVVHAQTEFLKVNLLRLIDDNRVTEDTVAMSGERAAVVSSLHAAHAGGAVTNAALLQQMKAMRSEMKEQMKSMQSEMKEQMESMRNEMKEQKATQSEMKEQMNAMRNEVEEQKATQSEMKEQMNAMRHEMKDQKAMRNEMKDQMNAVQMTQNEMKEQMENMQDKQATKVQVQNMANDLRNQIKGLGLRCTELCQFTSSSSQTIQALLLNTEARRKNRMVADGILNQNLVVLRKVNRGLPPELDILLEAEVNTPFPSTFPQTLAECHQLSRNDIVDLANWANDDMGISPNDNLETCRANFLRFITG